MTYLIWPDGIEKPNQRQMEWAREIAPLDVYLDAVWKNREMADKRRNMIRAAAYEQRRFTYEFAKSA